MNKLFKRLCSWTVAKVKKAAIGGALLVATAGAVKADGDGGDILPFSTPGGVCSGVVTVYPDGTASLQGQLQGVPFSSVPWARAKMAEDGSYYFDVILSDGDLIFKQRFWIPLQLRFVGTKADAQDGDDSDDHVGEITVQSQGNVGKGSLQLTG